MFLSQSDIQASQKMLIVPLIFVSICQEKKKKIKIMMDRLVLQFPVYPLSPEWMDASKTFWLSHLNSHTQLRGCGYRRSGLPANWLPQPCLSNTWAPNGGGLHPALGSWLSKPMHSQNTSSTTQRTLSPLSRPNLFWGTFKNVHVNSSIPGLLCGPSVKVGNQHSAGLCA